MNILVIFDGKTCTRQNFTTFVNEALQPSSEQKNFTGKMDKIGSCATSVPFTRQHGLIFQKTLCRRA